MSKWSSAAPSLEATLEIVKAHRKSASDDTHNIAVENNCNKGNSDYGSEQNCRLSKFHVLSTGSLGNIYDDHRRSNLIANPPSASIDSRGSSADTINSTGSNNLQIGVAIGAASAIASSIIAHGAHPATNTIYTHKNFTTNSFKNTYGNFSTYQRQLQSGIPSAQAQLYTSGYSNLTAPKLSKVGVNFN